MQGRIVVLETFDNPIIANIHLAKLKENDIPCFLSDENIVSINPLFANAVGGIKLNIYEQDIEKAVEILKEEAEVTMEEEPEITTDDSESKVVCPVCGSSNVSYGLAAQKRFNLLVLIISFALMVFPFKNKKRYHCFDCGNEFKAN
ncbi:MAG: DUF2007 domain-containing protein [Bacteroidota bacterium]|nr:DUF2007 domain-containing protein [Bacteroidota bacterium]